MKNNLIRVDITQVANFNTFNDPNPCTWIGYLSKGKYAQDPAKNKKSLSRPFLPPYSIFFFFFESFNHVIRKREWILRKYCNKSWVIHCVKNVCVLGYSGPYFLAIGPNTDRYSISLRIRSKCRKMRTRITPNNSYITHVFLGGSIRPLSKIMR